MKESGLPTYHAYIEAIDRTLDQVLRVLEYLLLRVLRGEHLVVQELARAPRRRELERRLVDKLYHRL